MTMMCQCDAIVKRLMHFQSALSRAHSAETYKPLIKASLEKCMKFWSSLCRKDYFKLEQVQRRAFRMVRVMENQTREEKETVRLV